MYRNYHALMIAWLRNELDKLPKCSLGDNEINIYDDSGKRLRYKRSSPKAKDWINIAQQRKELSDQLDRLIREWHSLYKGEPPEIKLPLKWKGRMNSAFFDEQTACVSDKAALHPTVYKGVEFRSKNEQMTAMVLDEFGIEWKYETKIQISKFLTIHPDFLVNVRIADRCFYIEVFGAPDDPGYAETMKNRILPYLAAGLRPGIDVMMVYAPTSHSFDVEALRKQIAIMLESLVSVSPAGSPYRETSRERLAVSDGKWVEIANNLSL